jgi:hypothetical protein
MDAKQSIFNAIEFGTLMVSDHDPVQINFFLSVVYSEQRQKESLNPFQLSAHI